MSKIDELMGRPLEEKALKMSGLGALAEPSPLASVEPVSRIDELMGRAGIGQIAPPPEAPWGDIWPAIPKLGWEQGKQAYGATLQLLGEVSGGEGLTREGLRIQEEAREAAAAIRPNVPEDSLKDFVLTAGVSSVTNVPLVVAGALTGGATLFPLLAMSIPVGLRQYGEYRRADHSIALSVLGGGIYGAFEFFTELIPTKTVLLKGLPFASRLITSTWQDIVGENVNTVAQDLMDWAYLNPDKTVGDFARERLGQAYRTTAVSVIAGPVMASTVHPFIRDNVPQDRGTQVLAGKLPSKIRLTGDEATTIAVDIISQRNANTEVALREKAAKNILTARRELKAEKKKKKVERIVTKPPTPLEVTTAPEPAAPAVEPIAPPITPPEVQLAPEVVARPERIDYIFSDMAAPVGLGLEATSAMKKHAKVGQAATERRQRFFYNDLRRDVRSELGKSGATAFDAAYTSFLEIKDPVAVAAIKAYDAAVKQVAEGAPARDVILQSAAAIQDFKTGKVHTGATHSEIVREQGLDYDKVDIDWRIGWQVSGVFYTDTKEALEALGFPDVPTTKEEAFTRAQYNLAWERAQELGLFSTNSLWKEFRGTKGPEGRMGRGTLRAIVDAWKKEGLLFAEIKMDEPTGRYRTQRAQNEWESQRIKERALIKEEPKELPATLETEPIIEPVSEMNRFYDSVDKASIMYIINMSKRRKKDTDYFLKDGPSSEDLQRALREADVPDDKMREFVLFVKEKHNVMTVADDLELANIRSLRALDEESAAIEDEELLQDIEVPEEDANLTENTEVVKDAFSNALEQHIDQSEKSQRAEDAEEEDLEESELSEEDRSYEPLTNRNTPSVVALTKSSWYQTADEAKAILEAIKVRLEGTPSRKVDDIRVALQYGMATLNSAYHANRFDAQAFRFLDQLAKDVTADTTGYRMRMGDAEFTRFKEDLGEASRYVATMSKVLLGADDNPQQPVGYDRLLERAETGHFKDIERRMLSDLSLYEQETGRPATAAIGLQMTADLYKDAPDLYHRSIGELAKTLLAKPELAAILNGVPVKVVMGEPEPGIGAGSFFPLENSIRINYGYITGFSGDTLMHESVHALLNHALLVDVKFRKVINALRNELWSSLPVSAREWLQGMDAHLFIKHLENGSLPPEINDPSMRMVYYSVLNNQEFMSGMLSEVAVWEYARKVRSGDSPLMSMLKRFWDAVVEALFGPSATPRHASLLQTTLATADRFLGNLTAEQAQKYHIEVLQKYQYDKAAIPSMQINSPFKYRTRSHDVEIALKGNELRGVIIPGRVKDANALFDAKLASPEFTALRLGDKEAADFFARGIDAYDVYNAKVRIALMEYARIKDSVGEAAIKGTELAKKVEKGADLDSLQGTEAEKNAARKFLAFFGYYKGRYRDHQRLMLVDSMNMTEREIFQKVLLDGEDVLGAVKGANKRARMFNKKAREVGSPERVGTTSYAAMESYFAQWEEIDTWGLEDYVTHVMKGSIAIVDGEGHILTAAETKQQAVERALRLLEERPELDKLYVDTTHWFGNEPAVKLSKGQYWALRSRMAKSLKEAAGEIESGVRDAMTARMLKKLVAIKPSEVWSPYLEERREILPGEESLLNVLPSYIHMMEKKMSIDPFIHYFRRNVDKFKDRPVLQRMMYDQMTAIRGQYGEGDRIADSVLASLGMDTKFAWTRGAGAIRDIMVNLKLGYRPIAALINYASGMGHIWVKTGVKYVYQAQRLLKTPEGKAFIEQYAPHLGVSFTEKQAGIQAAVPLYMPLGLFQAPELPVRSTSLIANYLFAKEVFKHSDEEAIEFAKRSVRVQEFDYSVAALPQVMRGPLGKVITQFKPYLVKEIEFIRSLNGPREWARYLFMMTALAGPRGFMITLKSLPLLALIKGDDWLDKLDQWMNIAYPRLSRGVFGYFGIDASAPASFQFPDKVEEWMGITVSELIRFYKDIYVPLSNGESYITEDIKKYIRGSVPIAKLWSDLIESTYHGGWIWDDKGNKKYQVKSWEDAVKMAMGAKPLTQSMQDLEIRITQLQEEEEKAQARKIVRQFVKSRHMLNIDRVVDSLVEEMAVYAISPRSVLEAIEVSETEPLIRQQLKIRLQNRVAAWERRVRLLE